VIGVGDYPQYGMQFAVYQDMDFEWSTTFRTTFGDVAAASAQLLARFQGYKVSEVGHLIAHGGRASREWVRDKLGLLLEHRSLFLEEYIATSKDSFPQ